VGTSFAARLVNRESFPPRQFSDISVKELPMEARKSIFKRYAKIAGWDGK
jgi:hypothetical protein